MSEQTSTRPYDIILFGATSFVGRLTAKYLVGLLSAAHRGGVDTEHVAPFTLALAGRNQAKLDALTSELAKQDNGGRPSTPASAILVADALNPDDMEKLATSARVIISTVGPYTQWGDLLVDACATHGTDYVDLCGEAPFIRRNIDRNHALARETGARIVHSCGFDSVPSDIGMLALSEAAGGAPFSEVTMVVRELKGGLSGGTIASMEAALTDPDPRLHGRFQLTADPDAERAQAQATTSEPHSPAKRPQLVAHTPDGWAGPFFMGMFNTLVVYRSNSLTDHTYGRELDYREYQLTGSRAAAYGLAGALGAVYGLATSNNHLARTLWERVKPAPGSGPSEKAQREGHFTVAHWGITESGEVYRSIFSGSEDPGYAGTARFLGEAALTLLHHRSGSVCVPPSTKPQANTQTEHNLTGGGVLTPATGLGPAYIDRLRGAGFTIRAEKVQ
ncbi:MAG: saccharopine dehydrogenase NADP-binding domain-containing protein [Corynebacterium sp.]|nr:saccharopine dehydrogenase NADP-binding domain-containing protein [Corynebacterium sp.]